MGSTGSLRGLGGAAFGRFGQRLVEGLDLLGVPAAGLAGEGDRLLAELYQELRDGPAIDLLGMEVFLAAFEILADGLDGWGFDFLEGGFPAFDLLDGGGAGGIRVVADARRSDQGTLCIVQRCSQVALAMVISSSPSRSWPLMAPTPSLAWMLPSCCTGALSCTRSGRAPVRTGVE